MPFGDDVKNVPLGYASGVIQRYFAAGRSEVALDCELLDPSYVRAVVQRFSRDVSAFWFVRASALSGATEAKRASPLVRDRLPGGLAYQDRVGLRHHGVVFQRSNGWVIGPALSKPIFFTGVLCLLTKFSATQGKNG